jgi:Ca2+-binding RTX toxin-like protein
VPFFVDLNVHQVGELGGTLDTVRSIGRFSGSSAGDTLIGDDEANWLQGLGGDDHLEGRGGSDHLMGNEGADFINGGDGDDRCDPGFFPPDPGDIMLNCE